jgi:2-dehydropantoate 2-reductase
MHVVGYVCTAVGSVSGGADVTQNLWGARWSKLATNCYINVTAGLSGLKTMEVRTLPSAIPIATCMAAEACQVAAALGINIEPVMGLSPDLYTDSLTGDPSEIIAVLKEQAGQRGMDALASMLQDVIKNRRTEIDYLNGYVSDEGKKLGIPTPFCDAATAMVRDAGVGGIVADPENLVKVVKSLPVEKQELIESFRRQCEQVIGSEEEAKVLANL